jgi:hypothetical protein
MIGFYKSCFPLWRIDPSFFMVFLMKKVSVWPNIIYRSNING